MMLVAMVVALCASCTASDEQSMRVLEGAGYTEIRLGRYPFFACSDDDSFSREFTAVGPMGRRVSGAVCCGMWKNCTIRMD